MGVDDLDVTNTRYSNCYPFVVEDDVDYRTLLARAFTKAGVPKSQLRMLPDSEEAIEALKTLTSDAPLLAPLQTSLIVLDVGHSGKPGLDVLAWLRGSAALKEVPVFILSSSDHGSHVAQAFGLRTDSSYIKPWDLKDLQAIVEGMLGFWHARTYRRPPEKPTNSGTE